MRDHVKVLAFLHIALGAMGSLGAVVILGVFTFGGTMVRITADNDPEALLAAPVIFVLGVVLFAIILVCSVPGLSRGSAYSTSGPGPGSWPSWFPLSIYSTYPSGRRWESMGFAFCSTLRRKKCFDLLLLRRPSVPKTQLLARDFDF